MMTAIIIIIIIIIMKTIMNINGDKTKQSQSVLDKNIR